MKYRIAKKLIKRTQSVRLWIESYNVWRQAFKIHMGKHDEFSMAICIKFIEYDWKMAMDAAPKTGLTIRHLRAFSAKKV